MTEAQRIAAAVATWPESRRESYEERAGIKEYCGNLPRAQAEREAYLEHGGQLTQEELWR